MAKWERESERKKLWQLFDRKKNIALFATRRLGKTWLMRALEQEADQKGYNAVFIDLEAETTTKIAVRKICKTISEKQIFAVLWKQAGARIVNLLQGDNQAATYQELLLNADWESMLHATLKTLDESDKPTLILIDEISVCLSTLLSVNKKEGTSLMRSLREHRQKYKNIRWMLTGSIGLDHVADQYGLGGAINDLDPFPLNPFSADEAKAYVDSLCKDSLIPLFGHEIHLEMQKRLGWLAPHYLSRLFDRVEDIIECSSDKRTANIKDVDEACKTLLTHPYNRVFSDWADHINRNYPDDQKTFARKLLKILCGHRDGETIEAIRNNPIIEDQPEKNPNINTITNTLISLENDGFLHLDPNTKKYSFIFGLLREYWKRYQSI